MSKVFRALGLMSGTSMDGIDVAFLKTDGIEFIARGTGRFIPYSAEQRNNIEMAIVEAGQLAKQAKGGELQFDMASTVKLKQARETITNAHIEAVEEFLAENSLDRFDIDLIGFHGQTVLHQPELQRTMQIGDGGNLAQVTEIPVVCDLRQMDIQAGGQGAPLVPVYHQALVKQAKLELPVAVLNVGGVANVTYVGTEGELIAFDTGPGNALIDDWVSRHDAGGMDEGGMIAAKGRVKESVLAVLLNSSYFSQDPPKSLDRNHFSLAPLDGMSLEWGAMTLTSFTALAASRADFFFPTPPQKWVICGGGAHNPTLMKEFQKRLSGEVLTADQLGWSSKFMEAEAFAYLAVRSLKGLPLTFPTTTGVGEPLTGGVLHKPQG